MKQLNEFLAFLKKNRVIIYVILGLALTMQICSRGALPPVSKDTQTIENNTPDITQTPLSEAPANREQPSPQSDYTSLLLMAIIVLTFVLAKRYGYLKKIIPQVVVFRVKHYKQKSNGRLVLKIILINHTQRDISFMTPSILFFKGNEKREFTIKNIGGYNYFPLTLMPGTGQKLTIDAQKFYDQVDGLEQYKTICMKICSTSGKSYQSIKWPVYLTFLRH